MKLKNILGLFPKMHFHLSSTKINEIKDSEQKDAIFKPKGLWYSIGNKWIEWNEIEQVRQICCYLYVIEPTEYTTLNKPDKNKVLLINTIPKVIQFSKKYKKQNNYDHVLINWKKVAKDFGGIEFNPFFHFINNKKLKYVLWYTTLDIPSGCIWNKNLIKIKLLLENKNNKWKLTK